MCPAQCRGRGCGWGGASARGRGDGHSKVPAPTPQPQWRPRWGPSAVSPFCSLPLLLPLSLAQPLPMPRPVCGRTWRTMSGLTRRRPCGTAPMPTPSPPPGRLYLAPAGSRLRIQEHKERAVNRCAKNKKNRCAINFGTPRAPGLPVPMAASSTVAHFRGPVNVFRGYIASLQPSRYALHTARPTLTLHTPAPHHTPCNRGLAWQWAVR